MARNTSNLKKMKQVDGQKKIEFIREKEKPKSKADLSGAVSLDQLLGGSGTWKYKTLDEEEYIKELKEMPWADLQTHAINNSIIPIDDRPRLINKLLVEFRNHRQKYLNIKQSLSKVEKLPAGSPERKKVLDLMADGK